MATASIWRLQVDETVEERKQSANNNRTYAKESENAMNHKEIRLTEE